LEVISQIGASMVVVWELSGAGGERQRRGLRLIGYAFAALAVYLLVQSTVVLAAGDHPRQSLLGSVWTAVTAAVMFALAVANADFRTGGSGQRSGDFVADGASAPPGDGGGGGEVCFAEDG
jgi:hypothetical protein